MRPMFSIQTSNRDGNGRMLMLYADLTRHLCSQMLLRLLVCRQRRRLLLLGRGRGSLTGCRPLDACTQCQPLDFPSCGAVMTTLCSSQQPVLEETHAHWYQTQGSLQAHSKSNNPTLMHRMTSAEELCVLSLPIACKQLLNMHVTLAARACNSTVFELLLSETCS